MSENFSQDVEHISMRWEPFEKASAEFDVPVDKIVIDINVFWSNVIAGFFDKYDCASIIHLNDNKKRCRDVKGDEE